MQEICIVIVSTADNIHMNKIDQAQSVHCVACSNLCTIECNRCVESRAPFCALGALCFDSNAVLPARYNLNEPSSYECVRDAVVNSSEIDSNNYEKSDRNWRHFNEGPRAEENSRPPLEDEDEDEDDHDLGGIPVPTRLLVRQILAGLTDLEEDQSVCDRDHSEDHDLGDREGFQEYQTRLRT